ncbi:site-specific integrase [Alicyclobacillus tolerans]|uniref:site-specific integrase n=1 Tax=Alicyclobacillus tolerans TaxID=90970 RepID=UPI001F444D44|nr:site-specific integrase [Alicyclobacillus tolerans]MCF8567735.1 site-specific integrase [Alicyclobacillus tolerans]
MADLIIQPTSLKEWISQSDEQIKGYLDQSKADNTKKSYSADWAHFQTWCLERGFDSLPTTSQVIARYLADMAGQLKVSTLQRRLAAINAMHRERGLASFSTRQEPLHSVWSGIVRKHGTAPSQKAPTLMDDIRAMVNTLPNGILGERDRALLLVGFAGAMRRSELVGLNVEDIEFVREGLRVTIRKSKTDQEGQGHVIAIPYGSHIDTCPVRSLQAWLEVSNISEGPLFRPVNRHGQVSTQRLSDHAVAKIVKRAAEAAGLDASKFSGHSLRAGHATSAAQAGVQERIIMRQTRHRSIEMVRRYIREGDMFRENSAAELGL